MSLLASDAPLTMDELHSRRHAALVTADVQAGNAEALRRRIVEGEKKIDEAKAAHQEVPVEEAAAHWKMIDNADLRLAGLRDELQLEILRWEVPAEILDALYSLGESLVKKGLPEDSFVTVSIPGFMHLTLNVWDADEVAF